MTVTSSRPIAARRDYRRASRPNVVQLIPGRTPLPIGPRKEANG
jgi:hypothetical protein